MKIKIALFILLLIVSYSKSYSQISRTPYKGTNIILIQTDESIEKSYENFLQVLADCNFKIKSINKDDWSIETEKKWISGANSSLAILAKVYPDEGKDGALIEITGIVTSSMGMSYFETKVTFNPNMDDSITEAFQTMQSIAVKYPKGKIFYTEE
ncbi:hypothetical protein [Aureibacter tunicatorum]|uniref:Uncharacterized protein n=1 Tax=Aureibacter tunicatorum TaxID=866807 RepID=A0AAE3XNE8_9BACT|nr:hypothetical protein [Aureibacter tunicatorum]MDR6239085.1 hypothetical protein [Aureibacter tunicatorum]BDD04989.1 hypothetical protein AUTU_24720 [Aureibacter tunicatorum]